MNEYKHSEWAYFQNVFEFAIPYILGMLFEDVVVLLGGTGAVYEYITDFLA